MRINEFSVYQLAINIGTFAEMIKKPTRGNYLLDLFLTDFTGAFYTDILPCISDHKCTQMSINMNFQLFTSTSSDRWNFGAANWKLFYQKLATADWRMMDSMDVNDAVLWLNTRILAMMSICIPKLCRTTQSTSRPWSNETCFALI